MIILVVQARLLRREHRDLEQRTKTALSRIQVILRYHCVTVYCGGGGGAALKTHIGNNSNFGQNGYYF